MNNEIQISDQAIAAVDMDLVDELKELIEKAKADNTLRAYRNDFIQFCEWCAERNYQCLPASPKVVGLYIAHLAKKTDFKKATILRKSSSINWAHKKANQPIPHHHDLKEALKGLRRDRATEGKGDAPALRIEQIEYAARQLDTEGTTKAKRDKAILLLGFFGAFRRSELATLRWDSIRENSDGSISIDMLKTKTDQDGSKKKVKWFKRSPVESICPVAALEAWRIHSEGSTVFCGVRKGGKPSGNPIHGEDVNRLIKRLFGAKYSAHSLRSGFITAAAGKSATLPEIAKQTGHDDLKTLSDYIRHEQAGKGNALNSLY